MFYIFTKVVNFYIKASTSIIIFTFQMIAILD